MIRSAGSMLLGALIVAAAITSPTAGQSMAKMDGPEVKLDNLKSKTFGYWQQEKSPPKPAVYQFVLPAKEKGSKKDESAILTITPVTSDEKAVFDELKQSMEAPAGKKLVERVTKIKTGAGEVSQLYLYGTYLDKSGSNVQKKDAYRVLGIVLPSKDKKYLITLIGPSLAVGVNQGNFLKWVQNFK